MTVLQARNHTTRAVVFDEHGDPTKVLRVTEFDWTDRVKTMKNDQVLIQMIASSVNPADFNMVEGTYATKVSPGETLGGEGVGVVIKAGDASGTNTSGLNVGDFVIPVSAGEKTWASHVLSSGDHWYAVPSLLRVGDAASLMVNPCTAYRLIHDFGKNAVVSGGKSKTQASGSGLGPGDVLIQNGASSAVGQSVIQICAARGIKTINIVRDRSHSSSSSSPSSSTSTSSTSTTENDSHAEKQETESFEELKERLVGLGATVVVEQSTADDRVKMKEVLQTASLEGHKAKVALNCVGGKSGSGLARHLADGGDIVTYGGMSRQPMLVGAGPLIFNDIAFRGFWMTRWGKARGKSDAERERMMSELIGLMLMDKLMMNTTVVPVHDTESMRLAVTHALTPHKRSKVLISFMNDIHSHSTLDSLTNSLHHITKENTSS